MGLGLAARLWAPRVTCKVGLDHSPAITSTHTRTESVFSPCDGEWIELLSKQGPSPHTGPAVLPLGATLTVGPGYSHWHTACRALPWRSRSETEHSMHAEGSGPPGHCYLRGVWAETQATLLAGPGHASSVHSLKQTPGNCALSKRTDQCLVCVRSHSTLEEATESSPRGLNPINRFIWGSLKNTFRVPQIPTKSDRSPDLGYLLFCGLFPHHLLIFSDVSAHGPWPRTDMPVWWLYLKDRSEHEVSVYRQRTEQAVPRCRLRRRGHNCSEKPECHGQRQNQGTGTKTAVNSAGLGAGPPVF